MQKLLKIVFIILMTVCLSMLTACSFLNNKSNQPKKDDICIGESKVYEEISITINSVTIKETTPYAIKVDFTLLNKKTEAYFECDQTNFELKIDDKKYSPKNYLATKLLPQESTSCSLVFENLPKTPKEDNIHFIADWGWLSFESLFLLKDRNQNDVFIIDNTITDKELKYIGETVSNAAGVEFTVTRVNNQNEYWIGTSQHYTTNNNFIIVYITVVNNSDKIFTPDIKDVWLIKDTAKISQQKSVDRMGNGYSDGKNQSPTTSRDYIMIFETGLRSTEFDFKLVISNGALIHTDTVSIMLTKRPVSN